MSRTGMADLIVKLRGMTDTGTADFTVGTVSYWSSDQLQEILDRSRMDVVFQQLSPLTKYVAGGSTEYYEYLSGLQNLEKTTGGTSVYIVHDAAGSAIGTALYTADYDNGVVTFGADQAGSSRYLSARAYNIYRAAADVWRQKAALVAVQFDFSTDNHSVKRSDLRKAYMDVADYYQSLSGPNRITVVRDDTVII